MKRKILSVVLTLAMALSLLPTAVFAVEYSDTTGHWAASAIDRWSGYGVVQGTDDGFQPDASMTRAQAATVFSNLLGLKVSTGTQTWADADPSAWYMGALRSANDAGIMNGVGDGRMNPNGEVTREQFFTMFARAIGLKPQETTSGVAADGADWSKGYINALTDKGFVKGDGTSVNALADINRASVMTLLDQTITTYANEPGATVEGTGEGVVLVAADGVTVTGNVDTLVVAEAASGETGVKVENATVGQLSVTGATEVALAGETKVDTVVVAEAAEGASLAVESGASVAAVEVAAPKASIENSGVITSVQVAETATAAEVKAEAGSYTGAVVTEAKSTNVSGSGAVANVVASGDAAATGNNGVKVSTAGTKTATVDASGETKTATTSGTLPAASGSNAAAATAAADEAAKTADEAVKTAETTAKEEAAQQQQQQQPTQTTVRPSSDSDDGPTYYTVTFNANAPEKMTATGTVSSMTVAAGSTITLPGRNAYTIEGNKFLAVDIWCADKDGNSENYGNPGETYTVRNNVTLYAMWCLEVKDDETLELSKAAKFPLLVRDGGTVIFASQEVAAATLSNKDLFGFAEAGSELRIGTKTSSYAIVGTDTTTGQGDHFIALGENSGLFFKGASGVVINGTATIPADKTWTNYWGLDGEGKPADPYQIIVSYGSTLNVEGDLSLKQSSTEHPDLIVEQKRDDEQRGGTLVFASAEKAVYTFTRETAAAWIGSGAVVAVKYGGTPQAIIGYEGYENEEEHFALSGNYIELRDSIELEDGGLYIYDGTVEIGGNATVPEDKTWTNYWGLDGEGKPVAPYFIMIGSGRTLTVNGTLDLANIDHHKALANEGTLIVKGTLKNAGEIDNKGTLTNYGTLELGSSGSVVGTITNSGTGAVTGSEGVIATKYDDSEKTLSAIASIENLKTALGAAVNGDTITLEDNIDVSDLVTKDTEYILAETLADGVTFDGGNRTITCNPTVLTEDDAGVYLFEKISGTVKNLTFNVNSRAGTATSLAYVLGGEHISFEKVKVMGTQNVYINDGFFAHYAGLSLGGATVTATFTNCEVAVTATGGGSDANYNAAFIGAVAHTTANLTFTNCIHSGTFVSGKTALFIGNVYDNGASKSNTRTNVTVNVDTESKNTGTMRSTYVDGKFKANILVAKHSNYNAQLGTSILTVKVNNVSETSANEPRQAELLNINDGTAMLRGPENTGMELTKNGVDLIIAPATEGKIGNIAVAKYVVSVATHLPYTDSGAGGATWIEAKEEIAASSDSLTTSLKAYSFVTEGFNKEGFQVSANKLGGFKTISKDGNTYYLVENKTGEGAMDFSATTGVTAPISITMYAYSADGTLLGSVTLTAGE